MFPYSLGIATSILAIYIYIVATDDVCQYNKVYTFLKVEVTKYGSYRIHTVFLERIPHSVFPVYKCSNHSSAVRQLPNFMHCSCAMTQSCVSYDWASLLAIHLLSIYIPGMSYNGYCALSAMSHSFQANLLTVHF